MILSSALCLTALPAFIGAQDATDPVAVDRASIASRMERLPEAIASFGGALLDGEIYVTGGHVGRKHEHSIANLSSGFLRVAPEESTRLAGGVPLQGLALVACDGVLIRIGGLSARNEPGEEEDLHSVDACAAFDPRTQAWTEMPALPEPRSSHDAIAWNGKVYVAGGWSVAGGSDDAEWCTAACVLDPDDEAPGWTTFEQPFRRRALSVVAASSGLWAIGGLDEAGRPSAQVDVFDFDGSAWRSGPNLPEHGFGASAAVLDDRVYVSTASGTVWRATSKSEGWERAGELAIPRMFHRMLPTPEGGLVVLGGAASGGHTNSIEWFDPRIGVAALRARSLLLDHEARAFQRQGFALHGDELFVLGGNKRVGNRDFGPEDFLDECYSIHLLTGLVAPCAPLPAPRQSLETVSLVEPARAIVACGGFGHDGTGERSFADVWKLDPTSKTWEQTGAALPSPLTGFGLVALEGRLLVIGGMDHVHRDEIRATALTWPLEPFAALAARMPEPRRAFGGAVGRGEYFVVGGLTDGFEPVVSCTAFDAKSGSWSSIPSPSRHRIAPSLVAWRDALVLLGGSSRGADGRFHAESSVEVFDLDARTWSTWIDELPFESDGATFFVWRDRLVAYRVDRETGRGRLWFLTGDPSAASSARG